MCAYTTNNKTYLHQISHPPMVRVPVYKYFQGLYYIITGKYEQVNLFALTLFKL